MNERAPTKEKCFSQMCIWVANIHRWSTPLCCLWSEWVNFQRENRKVKRKKKLSKTIAWSDRERGKKISEREKSIALYTTQLKEKFLYRAVIKTETVLSPIITRENSLNEVGTVRAKRERKLKIVCSPLSVYSLSKSFSLFKSHNCEKNFFIHWEKYETTRQENFFKSTRQTRRKLQKNRKIKIKLKNSFPIPSSCLQQRRNEKISRSFVNSFS